MLAIGDSLPQAQFQAIIDGAVTPLTTEQLFAGKKVVLFAVPGAFTPTCSAAHLPGFVVKADEIKAKGVDTIICLSVNDAFVMNAWGKSQNADEILMLADGDASFSQATGLFADTGAFGGVRAKRYAMIVDNGVVTALNVDAPKQFEVSSAEAVLALL